MADKKKNSFRDMMLIVFVVVACFGLTIYGIIYLAGKVFSPEETINIAKIKPAPGATNPEDGDILTFTSKPEIKPEDLTKQPSMKPPAAEPITSAPIVAPKVVAPKAEPIKPPAEKQAVAPTPPAKPVAEPQKREPTPPPVQTAPVKPIEVPKPTVTTQKPTAKGRYVVQIMSLKSQKAADAEALKFKNSCPDVHVVKADLGGRGTWYRIRCGITNSKTIANETKNKIAAEFKIAPQVVGNE